MPDLVTDVARRRAAILAEALGETVAELRLIEPGDLVRYIRAGQWANIADLLHSSAELSFEEGALSFACAAAVSQDRAGDASIALEMEFQGGGLSAFFTLFLERDGGLVALRRVWFPNEPESPAAGTAALARAVADARLGHGTAAPLPTPPWR